MNVGQMSNAGTNSNGSIVTIGTFDGVHTGHRYLLDQVVARGRQTRGRTVAVTFEPLPPQVLRPDKFQGRICSADEKLAVLRDSGIDSIMVLEFSRSFAQQSPEEFLAWLQRETSLKELWVGEAFALGRNRVGDVPRLREIGLQRGFSVTALSRLVHDDTIVSSSAIRAAILAGDVRLVRQMLGRPYRVAGEVVHGAHLGRTIGFPTANVEPPADLVPLADGIYTSHAWRPNAPEPWPAMTYIGTRPTINTGARMVETHLLDFDGDLYGEILTVDLLDRLRGDRSFPTVEAMIDQLRNDEARARALLAAEPRGGGAKED